MNERRFLQNRDISCLQVGHVEKNGNIIARDLRIETRGINYILQVGTIDYINDLKMMQDTQLKNLDKLVYPLDEISDLNEVKKIVTDNFENIINYLIPQNIEADK